MVNLQSGDEYLFRIWDCEIHVKINSVHLQLINNTSFRGLQLLRDF